MSRKSASGSGTHFSFFSDLNRNCLKGKQRCVVYSTAWILLDFDNLCSLIYESPRRTNGSIKCMGFRRRLSAVAGRQQVKLSLDLASAAYKPYDPGPVPLLLCLPQGSVVKMT